jgi:ribosomal protein L16/L10AE
MLAQPRKPRYNIYQKFRRRGNWINRNNQFWVGLLFSSHRCKFNTAHFEAVRLRLVRMLRRRKRLSAKARFKMKRRLQISKRVLFTRSSFQLRLLRIF